MHAESPDLEGLQGFADDPDRDISPIFVGRGREIEWVRRQAERTGRRQREGLNTQGATIVITGCPGAGKSAFLGHFARTCATREQGETVLVPVQCAPDDLTGRNTEELETQLAKLLLKDSKALPAGVQAIAKNATEVAEGLKLGTIFKRVEQTIADQLHKRTVVCLLVDEIQTVTQASATALRLLHTRGFSPPVLPIYAGLDDSVDQLRSVCGISRLREDGHMTMDRLPAHAAQEATAQLFERYRVRSDATTRSAWGLAVEDEALQFAQHLHVTLKRACGVLLARGGVAGVEDIGEVKRRAREAREQFYASKVTGLIADHEQTMLDVVHQAMHTDTRLTARHLAKWVKDSMRRHDPLGSDCTNEEALALVEAMRHQGVLHLTARGRAKVAIPSLQTWLTGPYAEQIGWQAPREHDEHHSS